MKHKNTQKLTLAAMTAAAYAALSLLGAVFGLTFGPIQVRFSEALCLLPFLFPETAWGLGVGCLIANLFSPYGALDIVVGSLSTLIAALLTARCRSPWTAALPPVVCNMVLVPKIVMDYFRHQQHPATAGQEAVGLRQHLQIHRLQQVVFQQPGQGDVLQRLLVAVLIVDNREASALVHGFTPPFYIEYHCSAAPSTPETCSPPLCLLNFLRSHLIYIQNT